MMYHIGETPHGQTFGKWYNPFEDEISKKYLRFCHEVPFGLGTMKVTHVLLSAAEEQCLKRAITIREDRLKDTDALEQSGRGIGTLIFLDNAETGHMAEEVPVLISESGEEHSIGKDTGPDDTPLIEPNSGSTPLPLGSSAKVAAEDNAPVAEVGESGVPLLNVGGASAVQSSFDKLASLMKENELVTAEKARAEIAMALHNGTLGGSEFNCGGRLQDSENAEEAH
ncbi:hypothetical protein EST38_g12383 [Candolleomyces aberdarensis]|uniref:Uncharacterized protein n=1 Tax=Candolleomyces aberdarensis TaxID=2316362 RepID=A0A4Q2D2K0_9AGAR|nr:hypothetical protein EST38_g12383 [Candolleomyces aberdarensis]